MSKQLDVDVAATDPAVGTIIMWGADAAPPGWVLCNGQTLSTADYPLIAGNAAFHKSADGSIQVPDLRGYFVRGVDDREAADGVGDPDARARVDMFDTKIPAPNAAYSIQPGAIGSHKHVYSGFPVQTDSDMVCVPPNDYWGGRLAGYAVGSANSQAQLDAGAETRPTNVYLRYIICVGAGSAAVPAVAPSDRDEVPLGTIALWGSPTAPANWQLCNGSSQDAAPGSDLEAVADLIGESFGTRAAGQITVPDLRGQFIRGADAAVGVTQADALQSHSHPFTEFPGESDWWDPSAQDLGGTCYTDADGQNTGLTGGSETRPVNAAFYFIIKSQRVSPPTSVMPIGAIVMWPADKSAPLGWLLCNGVSYQINPTYSALYKVILNAFRPNRVKSDPGKSPDGQFYVPDLTGMFVRGLDDSGLNRDPNAGTRTNLDGKATLGGVLGSLQTFALGGHPHSVSAFPGDWTPSGQRFGATTFSGWINKDGMMTHATGDTETRPRNTALNFIIKYSDWAGGKEVGR